MPVFQRSDIYNFQGSTDDEKLNELHRQIIEGIDFCYFTRLSSE